MKVKHKTPSIFKFGDQGILNYLVFAKSQRGEIKMDWADLQWSRNFGFEKLTQDVACLGFKFPNEVDHPAVLHFCGRKPSTLDAQCFSRPFTIARLSHHRQSHGNLGAWMIVFREDGRAIMDKVIRKIKRFIR